MNENLRQRLKHPESYLPTPMQDFHDCKDLFQRLQEIVDNREWHGRKPDWITCHIYTVDVFLWFMAAHGYTLQKSRLPHDRRPEFLDLGATMKEFEERKWESFDAMMRKRQKQKEVLTND